MLVGIQYRINHLFRSAPSFLIMMATRSDQRDLCDLPMEILQQIAAHLLDDTPSLSSFSRASQTCHSAAIPSLFHTVRLVVHTCEALQQDVETLIATLLRSKSAGHVRRISIKGSLRLDAEGSRPSPWAGDMGMMRLHRQGLDDILEGQEPVLSTGEWQVCRVPVIKRSSGEDNAWAPVVSLMGVLPGLDTLVYDCQNQFPPLLLDAVHSYGCKLHHLTFRFRSLLEKKVHRHEMAVATSPSLHKLRVRCSPGDSNGEADFNREAVMELAAGLAPNLKELIVVGLEPPVRTSWSEWPPRIWKGLPGLIPGQRTGSLTSLTLIGSVDLSLESLREWRRHVDFAQLHHMSLGGGYCTHAKKGAGLDAEAMQWVMENCSFPRLKTLGVRLSRSNGTVAGPLYSDAASAFFRLFEPLEALSVCGPLEPETLDTILARHGHSLRKLALRPTEVATSAREGAVQTRIPMEFEKKHIVQIQARCPALRELSLPIKRTMSSATEVEMYKSLGKISGLERLFLILDCSDWRVTRDSSRASERPFDSFDSEPCLGLEFLRKGHLRDTFVNCAVDERLARSIWRMITADKAGVPLKSLRLWTTGGGQWGNGMAYKAVRPVIDDLSRSWLLEALSDRADEPEVRELGRVGRELREIEWSAFRLNRTAATREKQEEADEWRVFRHIWPCKGDGTDWREDWESMPLESDDQQ